MAKYETRTSTFLGAVEEALAMAEELKDELESWKDNLPEQLQDGSKADELQDAIEQLDEAASLLEDIQGGDQIILDYGFDYRQVVFSRSTYMSRAKRLEQATSALVGAPTEVPEEFAEHEDADDFEDVLNRAQEALDILQSVSFPAMR